ncbi:hypothetical protein [Gloeobacter kilaueensis]|uniref:Tubulin-like protein n=1 Tax=Gloeobacter kilaueensis (strain ATCC BAA-2537 / CCAP 1431/1 / ULC 316 / JS1) TaxID=1183438 RepID=U5QCA8_GLOK1|nr:hypothetical protein [Gloeobacter kilaueensis]AGY56463.1 hypothetical protein GKIL_0216 [Gloeobacter kilaueensis JS1]
MSYYIVGIGGTGAKCVEALIHLAAAIPLDQPLNVLLVDPDTANGSLERTLQTLEAYLAAAAPLKSSTAQLLQTQIRPATPRVWSPFSSEQRPVLRDLFQYEYLSQQHPAAARLMDVLYSEQEKTAPLDQGFLGRPSIGVAVLADAVDLLGEPPWREFFGERLRNDNQARIFLVGSIFGGTGAAGLPTLARLLADALADRRRQYRLGCGLLLPYFSFPPGEDPTRLQARADEFLLRSQAALNYYQARLGDTTQPVYDALYLLGSDDQPSVGFNRLGSKEQRNPPHFLELYAAAAALHFFSNAAEANGQTYITARAPGTGLSWNSIPDGEQLRAKLANLLRFAYAYSSYFYPKLERQILGNGELRWTRWYSKEFFARGLSQEDERTAKLVRSYCDLLLVWLRDLQKLEGGLRIDLLNTGNFTVYPGLNAPNPTLDSLSGALDQRNRPRPGSDSLSGLSRFLHALYYECRPS